MVLLLSLNFNRRQSPFYRYQSTQPLYQFTGLVKKHDIQVLSGNFHLYTDMPNRVMQVLGDMAPATQQYSIDECFLDITGMTDDLNEYGHAVRAKVKQWTGIPVGVGIAETKTLAKAANRIAKVSMKADGVLNLVGLQWREKALEMTEVGDVWGVGKQFARKLNRNGIKTALDPPGRRRRRRRPMSGRTSSPIPPRTIWRQRPGRPSPRH
jgi:DNA polymerase V